MKKIKNKTRINLLPYEDKRRSLRTKKLLIVSVIFIFYIFLLAIIDFNVQFASYSKNLYMARLNHELQIISSKDILYANIKNAMLKKEKIQLMLKKEITEISGLQNLKIKQYKEFKRIISENLPDGTWLESVSSNKSMINLKGNSLSLQGISKYLIIQKKLGLFKKISLNNISKKIHNNEIFYTFNIKCFLY